jgi:tetratricopeptide (TPR) repeat protein
MTQMSHLFASASPADNAAALAYFERCVLSLPSIDTAFFRNRLAEQYGRGELFEREIAVLVNFDIPESPSGRRLLEVARSHFARRRYRHAANAAAAAHPRIEREDESARSSSAFMAHQSYLSLGIRDSALIWLRESGVTNRDARARAAALYQETGHLEAAAEQIDSLLPSIAKDTLLVRQRLFAGDPAGALNQATTTVGAWGTYPAERLLWRARCMVFGGRPFEAARFIDSLTFAASWHGAAEVLRYRYWLQKMEDAPRPVVETWGRLEYLIYTDDLTASARLLIERRAALTGEAGEMLTTRLARELARVGRHAAALEVLELVTDGQSPEYLYVKAEMLNGAGRREEARGLANRILTDHPTDIFAQRARMLLSR